MDDQIRRALAHGHTIDITTTGRVSGLPRRLEIVFHNIDGRIYITGMPRADRERAWLRNLAADPHLTFHLKGAFEADLSASARLVTDTAERTRIAEWVAANAWKGQDPAAMVAHSPMIEITFDDLAA